ncbi:MAG: hypothetical protein ACK6C8_09585, partial [Pseudanabaena sp.]
MVIAELWHEEPQLIFLVHLPLQQLTQHKCKNECLYYSTRSLLLYDKLCMNFLQIIMLTLFFFPAAPILYAPIPAPPKQQSKTIDFSENQNTIVSQPTPSAGLTR